MLVLFTDTDTDMTPEVAEKYGYRLISMPYSVDGKNIYPYVDFDKFDDKTFYDMLRGGVIPKTSALNQTEYIEYFEPVFANGDDILYVHFSRAMSATFNSMDLALSELKEKYPERKFYEIDTKAISIGSLNIVLEVGDMIAAGRPVDEVVAWANDEVDRFATYFFADDLTFFKHSGRVSGLAGMVGSLLGIRPIIHMDNEGRMVSIAREKGRAKALEHLIKKVDELGDDIKSHRVLVVHSDSPDIADNAIRLLKERLGEDTMIELWKVNPTAGSHCGPNAVGICFHAKHR